MIANTLEPACRQRGFSLIEVLVALLVLSIGLLGLAALQAQSVRFNGDSMSRTQATTLAYDIIDVMRSNRNNALAFQVDPAGGIPAPAANACTPTNSTTTAPEDLRCWLNRIQRVLPGGTATIRQQAGNPGVFDVTMMWLDREPRAFAGSAAPRLPANEAECEALAARTWNGNACLVFQLWTVRP